MVYKKYIKKGGRTFGPYYYESYRENGKVKTRFVSGPLKSDKVKGSLKENRNYFILGFVFLIVCLLILGVGWIKSKDIYTKTPENLLFSPPYGEQCVSDWKCEKWSDCYGDTKIGIQTRICADISFCSKNKEETRKCDFKTGKPVEIINGKVQIIEEDEREIFERLVCGDWDECNLNYDVGSVIEGDFGKGIQKKICQYEDIEAIVSRECDVKKEVAVKTVSDDKVLVYDAEDKSLIAKIIKGVRRLDIEFDLV